MSIWCAICNSLKPCEESVQLVPCLHTFCKHCLNASTKQSKICPVVHCYSSLSAPEILTSVCEAETCPRKITAIAEMLRTSCHHDICHFCYDMASRKEKLACPVSGCGDAMIDEDDLTCEGPCKQTLSLDKTIIIPCCGAKMCEECATKWTGGRVFCEPGKCVIKEVGKRKRAPDVTRPPCQGSVTCEGEVLRNFPSEFECEHDMCATCLATMLEECEKSGKGPVCPSQTCGQPYRCESVAALAAQFPEKKSYFSKFTLQAKFSMQTLRDSTVSNVLHGKPETVMGSPFTLKIGQCEDDDGGMPIDYIREGTLGDLIREIRRVLKILATDKIYGYYRVDDGKKTKLDVVQETIHLSCTALSIDENTLILVDNTGIVARDKKS